ncbi:MAG: GAF domain-containing protein [Thermanaerothrix sp.]|nr:GAF domain-containing protein [Thermanaerothrix sp.]
MSPSSWRGLFKGRTSHPRWSNLFVRLHRILDWFTLAVLLAGFGVAFWVGWPSLLGFFGVAVVVLLWDRGGLPGWIWFLLTLGVVSFLSAMMRRPLGEVMVLLGTVSLPVLWRLKMGVFNDSLIKVLSDFCHRLSSAGDLEDACRMAVRSLTGISRYHYVSAFLYKKDLDVLVQIAGSDNFDIGLQLPRGSGVVWRAFTDGKGVLVKDVRSDRDYVPSKAETRSEVAVPLQLGGKRMGVLNVESPFALERRDLWFICVIGSLLSYVLSGMEDKRGLEEALRREREASGSEAKRVKVLDRAVLQKERALREAKRSARVAEALLSIIRGPSAFTDLEGLCSCIVEAVSSLGYSNVYLLVRHEDRQDPAFELKAFKGLPQDSAVWRLPMSKLEGIWGWVVENRRTYLCNDAPRDPLYRTGHSAVRSELSTPIPSSSGQVLGILSLQDERPLRFNAEDVNMMEAVARYLGFMLEHSYHIRDLDLRMRGIRLLHDIVQEMAFCGSLEDMVRSVVYMVAERLGYRAVTVFKLETPEGGVSVMASSNRYEDMEEVNRLLSKGSSLVSRAARNGVLQNTPDVSKKKEWVPLIPTIRSQLDVPISIHGKVYGVLCIEDEAESAFGPKEEELFTILAGHMATVWRLLELVERVKVESMRDVLTGVPNIRSFKIRLAEMLSRAKSRGVKFAVVMMDLGGFKGVNDLFGHSTGDEVLKRFAKAVDRRTCDVDFFARYGGDEFVMLVWDVDEVKLKRLCGMLKELVDSMDFGIEYNLHVDLGYAVFPDDGSDGDQLIRLADEKMYNDKRERKGQDNREG